MTNLRNNDLNDIINRDGGVSSSEATPSSDNINYPPQEEVSPVEQSNDYGQDSEELAKILEDGFVFRSRHRHSRHHSSSRNSGSENRNKSERRHSRRRKTRKHSALDDYNDFVYYHERKDLTAKHHSHTHNKTEENKKTDKKILSKIFKGIGIVCLSLLILALIAAGSAFLMHQLGREALFESSKNITAPSIKNEEILLEDNGHTVKYKGHTYKYNENITTMLFIGVDKTSLGVIDDVVGTGGQADAIYLLAVDFDSGEITTFAIPRETMVDIEVYSADGNYLGMQEKQICLSYAYGDGKTKSCNNLISAVEKLFYGININSFMAMDLMGISAINDSIGGTEVVLNCDMTLNGQLYKAGEKITLIGGNAETFVRSRSMEDLKANIDRMDRQKIFLNAFVQKVLAKTKEDMSTPLNIFKAADEYTITNIDAARLTYFVSEFMQKGITMPNIQRIPGETEMGKEYAEYYVNNEEFYELFLGTYYTCID